MRFRRFILLSLFRSSLFAVCLVTFVVACQLQNLGKGTLSQRNKRPTPLPQGVEPNDLIDAQELTEQTDPLGPLEASEITKLYQDRHAEAMRERRLREEKKGKDALGKPFRQKEYNILLLSGGGAFGAYPAGVICGWSASGKAPAEGGRPEFDVVTGVSSGALISTFAFLGSEYDGTLRELYTNVSNDDIFKLRRTIRSLLSQSFANNEPLKQKITTYINNDIMAKVAAEHAKGRRLYMGTTNIDTKRLVVWDIGAIASKGTQQSLALIHQIILASTAIPGFFPPVKFDVAIDGAAYEELHVDGSISRSMFFRPPYFPPDQAEVVGPTLLAGSNLYAIVAGKYYPDPEGVKARTLEVVGASVSNLLYATTRGDLYRFYTYCSLSGMDYFTTAIPADMKTTNSSTNFDRCEMIKMFNEGYRIASKGAFTPTTKIDPKSTEKPPKPYSYPDGSPIAFKDPNEGWRSTPPGLSSGERGRNRAGLQLGVRKEPTSPTQPQSTDQNIVPPQPPVAK
jgi:predicted acylesterase/phospholipase RssA